jgi:hypothetical protein
MGPAQASLAQRQMRSSTLFTNRIEPEEWHIGFRELVNEASGSTPAPGVVPKPSAAGELVSVALPSGKGRLLIERPI